MLLFPPLGGGIWPRAGLGEMTLSYYDSNENADYEFGEMTLTNSNENAVYEFGEMTLSNCDQQPAISFNKLPATNK